MQEILIGKTYWKYLALPAIFYEKNINLSDDDISKLQN